MSDKQEGNAVDALSMPKMFPERDDPTSQELVALINTFTGKGTNSPETDDSWKDFKAALWNSLTIGHEDEPSSIYDDTVAKSHETCRAQDSLQTNTIISQVYESPQHTNLSFKLASWFSDCDTTAVDSVNLPAKQSYLPDLLRILNENEIKLVDEEESGTTKVHFHGNEYVLSNGPNENLDPFADVLFDGFDSFVFHKGGHSEDESMAVSEETKIHEGIFKVWDLGIPDEENEITRQLKALVESSGPPLQNSSANSIEEGLPLQNTSAKSIGEIPSLPLVEADEDNYAAALPSDDLSTALTENLDELVQGITNLSLNHS